MNGPAKVIDLRGRTDITPNDLMVFDIINDDIILLKTDNSDNWS